MKRLPQLLWLSWMGLCVIGAFAGSQIPAARTAFPTLLLSSAIGSAWVTIISLILKRQNEVIIAWIFQRIGFFCMYMPLFAAVIALILREIIEHILMTVLTAASMGTLLGLCSGLVLRPYLAASAQRRWMITNTVCGICSLVSAVVVAYAFTIVSVPERIHPLAVAIIISAGWGILPGALFASVLQTLPSSCEEMIQRRLTRPVTMRGRWIERVAVGISIIIIGLVPYGGRCHLITCQPATWQTILAIAQAQAAKAGPAYQIGMIRAEPAFRSELTPTGPSDITIRIELTSAQLYQRGSGMYPSKTIEFNDRDQFVKWAGQGGTSEPQSMEFQQRLSRVQISPRDVYQRTWQLAQRELSSTIALSWAAMSLYTHDIPQERFGIESAWAMTYYDDKATVTYWIDAQTGKIVEHTIEHYRTS